MIQQPDLIQQLLAGTQQPGIQNIPQALLAEQAPALPQQISAPIQGLDPSLLQPAFPMDPQAQQQPFEMGLLTERQSLPPIDNRQAIRDALIAGGLELLSGAGDRTLGENLRAGLTKGAGTFFQTARQGESAQRQAEIFKQLGIDVPAGLKPGEQEKFVNLKLSLDQFQQKQDLEKAKLKNQQALKDIELKSKIQGLEAGKQKRIQDLSKQLGNRSKDYEKVRDAFLRVDAASKDPSPAGDLAMIFNYMKVLDPGSVVRESEFRTAEAAKAAFSSMEQRGIPVPNFLRLGAQKALTGQRLLPEQREDFRKRAEQLAQTKFDTQVDFVERFRNTIPEDLDSRIITDLFDPRKEKQLSGLFAQALPGALPQPPAAQQMPQQPQALTVSEGTTATNPATGDKLIFRGGTWQPI